MRLIRDKSPFPIVFSRFPKAGSTWLDSALDHFHPKAQRLWIDQHDTPSQARAALTNAGVHPEECVYCSTAREPLSWLSCYYHYFETNKVWGGLHPGPTSLLWPVQEMSWSDWLSWLVDSRPGLLDFIYQAYVPRRGYRAYAIRTSHLEDDLLSLAHELELVVDEEAVRDLGVVNGARNKKDYEIPDLIAERMETLNPLAFHMAREGRWVK